MSARTYSARVMRFRRGVYANRGRISSGCQVLLLRLSDSMDAKGIVSIPRNRLAEEFDAPPARITEWINQATEAGFLARVRRGRPGVTAVYQGLFVTPEVRRGVPCAESAKGTQKPTKLVVRRGVPQNGAQRYAQGGSQVEVPGEASDANRAAVLWHDNASSEGEAL